MEALDLNGQDFCQADVEKPVAECPPNRTDEFRRCRPSLWKTRRSRRAEHLMSEKTRTGITEMRTVGVPVANQDRALEFYVDTLGFDTRLNVPMGDGERWIEVAPPGATTTVALVAKRDGQPAGTETGIRFSTEDADADHAHLRASGVDVDAEIIRWPGVPPMFTFRDPDGNVLVIVQRG
jgi:predicted enzyme related to lactoylglutathione lyase